MEVLDCNDALVGLGVLARGWHVNVSSTSISEFGILSEGYSLFARCRFPAIVWIDQSHKDNLSGG